MKKQKVCLKYLGCRLNEAELQNWSQQFIEKGFEIENDADNVDLIIINSCAVTTEAARKSRQNIRKLHRLSPQAKLVVTGCYASLEADTVAQILGVDLVLTNQQKPNLVQLVIDQLELKTSPISATEPGESALYSRHRDRAFIKIQDGCRWRCTYCIVTVARGEEVSRTEIEIIDEINTLYQRGVLEIVLTGVHVGGYGSDNGSNLKQLVTAILDQTEIPRIRFASVEPWDLPEDFFDLFENKRVMPHMHLPIQSGSDSVLKRMARRCKTDEFQHLTDLATNKISNFNITTDIIVGFPGETEEEWQQTLNFIDQQNFGHIHIFNFSPRQGTKAARLPNTVDNQIKKLRSQQLHKVMADQKRSCMERSLLTIEEILLESDFDKLDDGSFMYWGYSRNYLKVAIKSTQSSLAGCLVLAKLQAVHQQQNYILAEYISTKIQAKLIVAESI